MCSWLTDCCISPPPFASSSVFIILRIWILAICFDTFAAQDFPARQPIEVRHANVLSVCVDLCAHTEGEMNIIKEGGEMPRKYYAWGSECVIVDFVYSINGKPCSFAANTTNYRYFGCFVFFCSTTVTACGDSKHKNTLVNLSSDEYIMFYNIYS